MAKFVIDTEFDIGESVYHRAGESDKGIILNIDYNVKHNQITYEVCFGRLAEDTITAYEEELTRTPQF